MSRRLAVFPAYDSDVKSMLRVWFSSGSGMFSTKDSVSSSMSRRISWKMDISSGLAILLSSLIEAL